MHVITFMFNTWLQIKTAVLSMLLFQKATTTYQMWPKPAPLPQVTRNACPTETNLSLSPHAWCQGLGADRRQFCRKSVRYQARPRRTSVSHGTGVRGEGGRCRGLPARWALSRPWDPPTLNLRAWERRDEPIIVVQLGNHESLEIWKLGSLAAWKPGNG